MAVLVTGGAGYIGSHVVQALLDAGEKVIVLDDLSSGFEEAVPEGAVFVKGNICDVDRVIETLHTHEVDVVVHMAALVDVAKCEEDEFLCSAMNMQRTQELLLACEEVGVKWFVFSSTAAVYGNSSLVPTPVNQEFPRREKPISNYGRSKLDAEMLLHSHAETRKLRHVTLRYFNVAGADPKGRSGNRKENPTNLIARACHVALGIADTNYIEVFGTDYGTPDGTGVRDYIHVSDVAAAHVDAVHYLRDCGDALTLNCGYKRGFSVLEVLETVKRISGVDFEVRHTDRRPGDIAISIADPGDIHQVLGWDPQFADDLDEIVESELMWLRRTRLD